MNKYLFEMRREYLNHWHNHVLKWDFEKSRIKNLKYFKMVLVSWCLQYIWTDVATQKLFASSIEQQQSQFG